MPIEKPAASTVAICGVLLSLMLPLASFEYTLAARVTALETLAVAPSKDLVQIAAMQQSVTDLRQDLAEWKVEQRARDQATAAMAVNAAANLAALNHPRP